MIKFLGGLAVTLAVSNLISFFVLRYKWRKSKRDLEDARGKISDFETILSDKDSAITALESDMAAERAAGASAIEEIRALRDDVASCRDPAVVRASLGRVLQSLQASPNSGDSQ